MFPSDSNFETEVTFEKVANPISDEEPFNILLLGDWSGGNFNDSSPSDLFKSPLIEIDRDNFDEVLRKFQIKIDLDFKDETDNSIAIDIKEFDDFHPDNIFQQLPCFSHLHDIRRRLLNPDTFNGAAIEVRSWFDSPVDDNNDQQDSGISSEIPIDSDNLLDQILSRNSKSENFVPTSQTVVESELSVLIGKFVKPFLIQTDENEQSKLLEIVDDVTGDLMREILHHSRFQAIESAWRGLHFLVRRIETNYQLKLFLFDIGKEQLSSHLSSFDNLSDSEFYNLIVGSNIQNSGENGWSVICANFEFNVDVQDVASLMRIAKICSTAYAPFISYLTPKSLEKYSSNQESFDFEFDEAEAILWDTLRSIPESSYLGFALQRFIARLPYCDYTDPLETFSFDELKNFTNESKCVWTNPIFSCAFLLARNFSLHGWEMSRKFLFQIDDLPFYTFEENGETHVQYSLEFALNQKECINFMDLGFMTFISFQNSDFVRLVRFQSISNSSPTLNGRWL